MPMSQRENYLDYVSHRPGVELRGEHGLWTSGGKVENLSEAVREVAEHPGNVWTPVVAIRRQDAERLGYDSAKAWRDLLRAHRNDIAAAINIPPNDFRWYAAFHDEGDHSHVHMMAWSAKPGQAYLSKEGIRQIKSELANDIFKQELLRLYEQKSVSRDELVHEARKAMLELVQVMKAGICDHPDAEQLMLELAMQLSGQGQEVLWISPKVTEETGGSDRG